MAYFTFLLPCEIYAHFNMILVMLFFLYSFLFFELFCVFHTRHFSHTLHVILRKITITFCAINLPFANYFVLYDGNCHDFFSFFGLLKYHPCQFSAFENWWQFYLTKQKKMFFFTTAKRKEISGCFLFFITSLFIHLFGLLGAGEVFRLGLLSFRTSGFDRCPSHTERNIRSGVLPNRSSAPYRVLNLNIYIFAIAIINWHDKF